MLKVDMKETGLNLFRVIDEKGFRISEIADQLHISASAVYRWTIGKQLPTIEKLATLMQILDCSFEDLIILNEVEDDY